VLLRIDTCIQQHKFIYAAAGLMNTRFISQDMGIGEGRHMETAQGRIYKVRLRED
jgi:hypothetical protein